MVGESRLVNIAQAIMLSNWRGDFTVPNKKLYPFQWNWDSGFSALGFSCFKPEYAVKELRYLFSGQWENGLLPHILFHGENEKGYFPNPSFWGTPGMEGSPQELKTSGITQPPVHGFVLEQLFLKHKANDNVRKLVHELFPSIINYHRFLYKNRDPENECLVSIYHPWESGRDNSPLWDSVIEKMDIDKKQLPDYKRVDNTIGDPSERPTDKDYDAYIYLLLLGKKYQYAGEDIMNESPFLIQDTLFNAILLASNRSLLRLADEFGFTITEINSWIEIGIKSFNEKLWNDKLGMYCPFDLKSNRQIEMREVGGLIPWFANIPDKNRAIRMLSYFEELTKDSRDFRLCPSFDPFSPLYNSRRYWKGPIWPQINWLLYKGLQSYGFIEWAEMVKKHIIELVSKKGFHEYFDPEIPKADALIHGYGAADFTWTAAVILDLLSTP